MDETDLYEDLVITITADDVLIHQFDELLGQTVFSELGMTAKMFLDIITAYTCPEGIFKTK